MKVESQTPSKGLHSFVKSYTLIETTNALETIVLPHCGLVLAIQYKGLVQTDRNAIWENIPAVTLSGMRKSFRQFHYAQNTGTLLVNFTETGAAAIFKEPIFELFEKFEPVSGLFADSVVRLLKEQISGAGNNDQRIKIVDNFLMSKLIKPDTDKLVVSAIHEIYSHNGQQNIRSMAHHFHISQDAFEKRFRKSVGASPKQFSTIVRMKKLIAKGEQSKLLTHLAYDFEFYDQSHLIRQFKSFTGQSPGDFFKTRYAW